MQISTIRERWRHELTAFAWDQWAQLGVFAPTERNDNWAMDPEALLLFTLEVARTDPRLFDEVLDWLLVNEQVVSAQRLRNLCRDEEDRDLAEAALGWVSWWQPRKRKPAPRRGSEPRPLFRKSSRPVGQRDTAFSEVGLIKPETEPTRKSQQPDASRPIAFAIRMRLLFGVGTRAEVMRYLLSAPPGDADAQLITAAAAFAKRNVNEALGALVAAGAIGSYELGNERRYLVDLGKWQDLLGFTPETWPRKREWPQLLGALRLVARWIESADLDGLTPYLFSSRARDLFDTIEGDLRFAGVASPTEMGESFGPAFVDVVDRALASLNTRFG